jgi:predicted DNA-binding transcriptional regulator YafY
MNKWEKVFRLHRLCESNKYAVSLKNILDDLECSEATFHRIRAFLVDTLHAPLIFDKKYNGYCYRQEPELPRFEFHGLWFDKEELIALVSLDHAVTSLQNGGFGEIFSHLRLRLEPLLAAQGTNLEVIRNKIKIIPMQSRVVNQTLFNSIAHALIVDKCLKITYGGIHRKSITKRTISPQVLVRYRDNWYIDAWCHLRKELRTFALDRIEQAEAVSGKKVKVPRKDLEAFFADAYGIFNGKAKYTAELVFYGAAAREVSREQWHPMQQSKWLDEKSFSLSIPYGNDSELIMDILKWGELVEVLGPKELRERVKERLFRALKKYE